MKYLLAILITAFVTVFTVACDQGIDVEVTASADKPAAVVDAEKKPRGTVFEYGIYDAQRKGRVLGNLATNTGKIVRRPVLKLSETTDRIPLLKDTYFAYRYRLLDLPKEEAGKPVVELRKVLIHPPMTLPDGSISTGWDRTARGRTSIGQVIAFDGYVFSEDYELVAGEWTFQIWFKDEMLIEQKFTAYRPDEGRTESKALLSTVENKS